MYKLCCPRYDDGDDDNNAAAGSILLPSCISLQYSLPPPPHHRGAAAAWPTTHSPKKQVINTKRTLSIGPCRGRVGEVNSCRCSPCLVAFAFRVGVARVYRVCPCDSGDQGFAAGAAADWHPAVCRSETHRTSSALHRSRRPFEALSV